MVTGSMLMNRDGLVTAQLRAKPGADRRHSL
jgi:hypothetical protein